MPLRSAWERPWGLLSGPRPAFATLRRIHSAIHAFKLLWRRTRPSSFPLRSPLIVLSGPRFGLPQEGRGASSDRAFQACAIPIASLIQLGLRLDSQPLFHQYLGVAVTGTNAAFIDRILNATYSTAVAGGPSFNRPPQASLLDATTTTPYGPSATYEPELFGSGLLIYPSQVAFPKI